MAEGQIPTKALIKSYISDAKNADGAAPSVAFMGFGTFTLFAQDLGPEYRMQHTSERVGSAFVEIDYTKFFPDPYCKEGTVSFVIMDGPDCIPRVQSRNGLSYLEV